MNFPEFIVLGPNPAWQKTLFFDTFAPGGLNRAHRRNECPSGKGINCCRAGAIHGKCTPHLLTFTGGENGRLIRETVKSEKFSSTLIETAAPTRCCTTCLDKNGTMTEIIEPSFAATAEEVKNYLDEAAKLMDNAAGIALCGTLPTGTDPNLYPAAVHLAAQRKIPVLLDSFQNFSAIWKSGAELLLKINADELKILTGTAGIQAGLKKLFQATPVAFAAITDGPGQACAFDGKTLQRYTIPVVEKVVNPIGCGDTASAILISEYLAGNNRFDAFAVALGCAVANVCTEQPGSFIPADAAKFTAAIRRETVKC